MYCKKLKFKRFKGNKREYNYLISIKEHVERLPNDDYSSNMNKSCILFKENKYEKALENFKKAQQVLGQKPGKFK